MSQIKLALMGTGLVGLGICSIIWYFVKIISCIMIAGLISTRLCNLMTKKVLLTKILFYGNSSEWYNDLHKKYNKKVEEEE